MKSSEEKIKKYFTSFGYKLEYEKLMGNKRPEFTVYKNNKIVAIIEVKDFEIKRKNICGSFDPYMGIREKINVASKQFKFSKKYCCILIIDPIYLLSPATPEIVLGAMLGDLGISFNVDPAEDSTEKKPNYILGDRGKMLNLRSGKPQNNTVSAVGIMNMIKPDVISSGYQEKL